MKPKRLSPAMRELLWHMLSYERKPRGVLFINDDRSARALVRRGLLRIERGGYKLNKEAAIQALSCDGSKAS